MGRSTGALAAEYGTPQLWKAWPPKWLVSMKLDWATVKLDHITISRDRKHRTELYGTFHFSLSRYRLNTG